MTPEEIQEYLERHPVGKFFCDDPQCLCHESQLAIGIIAIQVEEGFLTPDEATRIVTGNPPNFGIATVSAHTVVSGQLGNIPSWSINQVYGASLYIRNLTAFYDGQDSYSVKVVTRQDRQTAIDIAKASLTAHVARIQAILAKPCNEVNQFADLRKLVVTWACQFAKYPSLPGMKVSRVRLEGWKEKNRWC